MASIDVLIWGATGFTGALVAEYAATRYGNDETVRFGLGGRSMAKLEDVRRRCATINARAKDWPLFVADSLKLTELEAMVKQTRVVISTVGPYTKYGTPLVEACVRQGVDYLDITGEVNWVASIIDKFHRQAEEKGVYLVPFCAFESVPFDLVAWLAENNIREMCVALERTQ